MEGGMRWAVIADIHGNLEALERVEAYLKEHQLERVMCLGDSISYGANPNECLAWVFRHCECHVLGNHEAALVHESLRWDFGGWARVALDWTAERMDPGLMARLRELSYSQIHELMTMAHGTIDRPEAFEYLTEGEAVIKSFSALKTFAGFVAHTHIPGWFSEKKPQGGGYLDEGKIRLAKEDRYLLNPGSVGQPRDYDPRLSFAVFDSEELTFEIVRLPYDNEKAAKKIRSEGLPRTLADRLL